MRPRAERRGLALVWEGVHQIDARIGVISSPKINDDAVLV